MYKIEVRNGYRKSYYFKEELKQEQFSFNKTGKYTGIWSKELEEEEKAKQCKKYFRRKGLNVIYFSRNEERSSNYHELYFRSHPPKISKYYICSYCSKLLKKENATIDHIIPIDKVKKNIFWRKVIKLLRWNSINDERNLTVACRKCNRKKSAKAGIWIIKGFLGQSLVYWCFCYAFIVSIVALIALTISYVV